MFSRRLPANTATNALTRALGDLRDAGALVVDLTESNPTRAQIAYPEGLLASLADSAALSYQPHPLGLPSARAAVAADHCRRDIDIDPQRIVLTASTSEAYTWLFKLLCNPGECVLVPRPSYPLFEHLTRLEGVRAEPYDLDYHGRWEIDVDSLAAAPDDVKAILVVSPNNPTGSFISAAELEALTSVCRHRRCALVIDEVFADYPLDGFEPLTDIAARSEVLSFTLGGLSKAVGLPQVKLGWIVVGGPEPTRTEALAALELIADSFLSVSTPVQVALPQLLDRGGQVRSAIRARTETNLRTLREAAHQFPACEVRRVEGGWSAVIRVPATRSEDDLVLGLLEKERILVHPGYFFDFSSEAFIVVSLLPAETIFRDAVPRTLRFATH